MSGKKWLSSLVRARQLQEDAAKQHLATAQRHVVRAHERVKYSADRVDSLIAAGAQDQATAFVAAAVARQAAAATHSATIRYAEQAEDEADARRDELGEAARARLTAEELNERHLATERHRAALAAQRELDEVAARIHRDGLGM
ncbi:MAG TPA: hypothetical protein VGL26_03365 [Jatrophihabitans sp.]|jgi:flagellar biosynthesis chaperone FliJ